MSPFYIHILPSFSDLVLGLDWVVLVPPISGLWLTVSVFQRYFSVALSFAWSFQIDMFSRRSSRSSEALLSIWISSLKGPLLKGSDPWDAFYIGMSLKVASLMLFLWWSCTIVLTTTVLVEKCAMWFDSPYCHSALRLLCMSLCIFYLLLFF